MEALDPPLIRACAWLRGPALSADAKTLKQGADRLAGLIEQELAEHAELRAKVDRLNKALIVYERSRHCMPKPGSALFEAFWEAWPAHERKRNKGDAETAWASMGCAELGNAVMAGLEAAKGSTQWAKDGGAFVPMPASWLRSKGWEDHYVANDKDESDPAGWAFWLRSKGLPVEAFKYSPEHIRHDFTRYTTRGK
jgi:hypothetical protein